MFFDEIQNVDEFELVINSFRATHDVSIFITGSNSKLLSGELATHLSGRTLTFRIMPFNFKEYCEYKNEQGTEKNADELLDDYMRWGGFPLVCKEEEEESLTGIKPKYVIQTIDVNSTYIDGYQYYMPYYKPVDVPVEISTLEYDAYSDEACTIQWSEVAPDENGVYKDVTIYMKKSTKEGE